MGEKEVSEQAAIVARYRDLFTRAQLDALHEARRRADGDDRERLYRLRKTCEAGSSRPSSPSGRTRSRTRSSRARVTFRGEELPLRAAQARLAVLDGVRATARSSASSSGRRRRGFNPERATLLEAREQLEGRGLGRARPRRAQRRGEGDLAARARARARAAADASTDA